MASAEPPGWYVISLRPQGGHAALRAAAARHGAGLLALSPWKLQLRDDTAVRTDLRAALACDLVVFTSPPAVRFAAALMPLRRKRGQAWIAVGDGTAAALVRNGIDAVLTPARSDSEGLLALPGLQDVRDRHIGLVTAPGGRGLLEPALRERGAQVHRANVYARMPQAFSPRAIAALQQLQAPVCLALSSGEALAQALTQLPATARAKLLQAEVIAASERLAALALDAGFTHVRIAAGPQPAQLLRAAAQAMRNEAA
jgi:uroporphyrinogen-III synthase